MSWIPRSAEAAAVRGADASAGPDDENLTERVGRGEQILGRLPEVGQGPVVAGLHGEASLPQLHLGLCQSARGAASVPAGSSP